MALTDPQETLAFHLSRPLSAKRDMSATMVAPVAAAMKAFMASDAAPGTVPETEALWFYAMNHGMAEVRKVRAPCEPLGDLLPFVEDYYRVLSPKAVRAFYYLMLICTREARHLHATPGLDKQVTAKFGASAWVWTQGAAGETAVQNKLFDAPPAMTLGNYVGALRHVFYNGKWSSGYGGKAWGQVTDCLCRFVHGEFTAEMMLDTVWTLAHNNGPIFNKGQLYGGYSPGLLKLLDVQASGQMHEMVLHDPLGQQFAPPELSQWSSWAGKAFGTVGPYVDWYAVESLGSKHKYPSEKMAQAKKHGVPASAAASEKLLAKKMAEAAAKAAAEIEKAKLEDAEAWFSVMPGLKVAKIQREGLAA